MPPQLKGIILSPKSELSETQHKYNDLSEGTQETSAVGTQVNESYIMSSLNLDLTFPLQN